MDAKVLISLVSVALGWLLAQATTFVREQWIARKLRLGLLTELEDIQDQLQRVVMIHGRQLQLCAINAMEPTAALPVQNLFFTQNFKEVFSRLNRAQRISYQLIHASLERLNEQNANLAKFTEESYESLRMSSNDESRKQAVIDLWGDKVQTLYKSAMEVRWHIAYHLEHPRAPVFDYMGPMHESYVQFCQELEEEVKRIMDGAKLLTIADFQKIYDPKQFRSASGAG